MIVTIRLPAMSGRAAILAAAHMLAPLLMPGHDPFLLGKLARPLETLLRCSTVTVSSSSEVSKLPGMNPAPMP